MGSHTGRGVVVVFLGMVFLFALGFIFIENLMLSNAQSGILPVASFNKDAGEEAVLVELQAATEATGPITLAIGPLDAGASFTLEIQVSEDITQAFDFYLLADTQFGPYTFYVNRAKSVLPGINATLRNIQGIAAPFNYKFTPGVILPMIMGGKEVTFYAVAVNAGRMPPVSSLSQLTVNTANVVAMYKEVITVTP